MRIKAPGGRWLVLVPPPTPFVRDDGSVLDVADFMRRLEGERAPVRQFCPNGHPLEGHNLIADPTRTTRRCRTCFNAHRRTGRPIGRPPRQRDEHRVAA